MPRRFPWPELLIILLAVVLRFALLDVKPPHFDEGVNGWFADQITQKGFYHYDPTNYHGPLHMYAVFASQTLFGRNLWALRLPSVLPGIACVALALAFARFVGTGTARWAALLLAVSPGMVFYARYSIHESWLVLFLMLTAWGILNLWTAGERRGLTALAVGITGMILTKETYFIHLGCLLLAFPCLWIWQKVAPSRPPLARPYRQWSARDVALATGLSVFAIVFFYSGTFLDWPGLRGLYETYGAWFATGTAESGHEKPAYDLIGPLNAYWVVLMARYEFPMLLGLAACFRFLWPTPAAIRYLVIAGGGTLLAYSIIPYKTPWLIISMLWPFAFALGYVISEFARFRVVPALATAMVVVSLSLSIRLNYREFTNAAEPYVYVQTFPEITKFTQPLLDLAARDPAAYHFAGRIALDSYYPLPWILGDFTGIGYYQDDASDLSNDYLEFIAVSADKADALEATLTGPYTRVPFRLRDGMIDCVAFFRTPTFAPVLTQ